MNSIPEVSVSRGMTKILTAGQVKELDKATITNEPITSIDLMERASLVFTKWLEELYPDPGLPVVVVCGTGNNGGDGLAVARMLHERKYQVSVIICRLSEKGSEEFQTNLGRLKTLHTPEITISEIRKGDAFPTIHRDAVLVDAIFGSGLNRPVEGYWAQSIASINSCDNTIISIDIPSGMMMDAPTTGTAVRADYCLSFELPKLAFFIPENGRWLKQWEVRSIGLDGEYLARAKTGYFYLTEEWIRSHLRDREKFAHKGHFGHILLVCGSYGKAGACVLATRAALRSGAGLATAHVPSDLVPILQIAVPEAMVDPDTNARVFSSAEDTSKYTAIGIGSGVGKADATRKALSDILQNTIKPMVLDADALNLISDHKQLLDHIPEGSILSPHLKEFERIFGTAESHFDRLRIASGVADQFNIFIVLKGAHTAVVAPGGMTCFNSTGNPGMATAGSGDVLTGVLTSVLGQGYSPHEAALIAVYIHGLAADFARNEKGVAGMIAGDIIDFLPKAFSKFEDV